MIRIKFEYLPVIDALLAALKDQDCDVRFQAVRALGTLSQADASVINALVDVLGDNELIVFSQAVGALGKLLRCYSRETLFNYL